METFSSFDTSGLNSNSSEVDLTFEVLQDLNLYVPISDSSQRRRTNTNRNNGPATTTSSLVSNNLTSQTSHLMAAVSPYSMLPTPEGSDNNAVCPESLIMSPYNMLPNSGHLTMEDTYPDDEFFFEPLESPALAESSGVPFLHNYITVGLLSPQTSPTLSPDTSMNITSNSPVRRHCHKMRYSPITKQKVSPHNDNPMSQSRRKSGNHNTNEQNQVITNVMTGSLNKFSSSSMTMSSLLELSSPLMDNMVETSIIASSIAMQDTMPNLNLGSNLVSDATNILSCESSSPSFSDNIAPITPSSLMKLQKKQPNSPKSNQNEQKSNSQNDKPSSQNQQKKQEPLPKGQNTNAFIAPTPPTQFRTNMIATGTGMAPLTMSPVSASRKSMRSNPNTSSPLALGPSVHSKSPHSLKPTISPNLKPKLQGVLADEVAEQLANKSNYRSILEGTAQFLGISYSSDVHSSLESRRTTHKAAEQKRRDSLKQSFDELKKVVPHHSSKGDGKSSGNAKSNDGAKNVSKLFLLKRAHDHIVELEQKSKEKDEIIQRLRDELEELRETKRQKIEETEVEDIKDEKPTTTS